ncbi:MAG: hypothetical protein AB7S26_07830 [Sandaracinaceae bacterium]
MRWWAFAVAWLLAANAAAQAAPTTQPPQTIETRAVRNERELGRAALRAGHFGDAYSHFVRAAELGAAADVWLEIGDVADRLRLDVEALVAYERYLALRPTAPDRAEVQARVDALREVRNGARFSADGGDVTLVREDAPASAAPGSLLVDWAGRPLERQSSRSPMIALADWDGNVIPRRSGDAVSPNADGLGRRLADPR